jgi:hypothetical protein
MINRSRLERISGPYIHYKIVVASLQIMSLIACSVYRALVFVLALFLPALANAQIAAPASYTGPCDLSGVTCAEAYSLGRAMTRSYSGPLFQVVVGDQNTNISSAAKHDATQIPGHGVNIADLRSFCGSPLSNCIVSKILRTDTG